MYNSRRPERVYGCKLNCDEEGSAPFVHPVPGSTSDDDVLPLLGDEDAIIFWEGFVAGGVPALLSCTSLFSNRLVPVHSSFG